MQGSAGGQLEPRIFWHMMPDQTKSGNSEVAEHLEKKSIVYTSRFVRVILAQGPC